MDTHDRVNSIGALVVAAVLAFATTGQYGIAVAQVDAQIFTDRLTYSPGDEVEISGIGFLANSMISLTINHPDYNIVNWDALSDENGEFQTIYRLDVFSETYTITATDGLNSASTTFSDPSVNMIGADAGVSTHLTAATAEDYGSFTVPPTTSVSKTIKVKGNGYGGGGPGAVPFPVACSASFDSAGSSAALTGKVTLDNSLCSITSNSPTGAGPVGVTVTTTGLLPGTYTGKLVGTATSGGTENYFFKLTIAAGDTSPPVITKVITGTLGDNGWYTSDVSIDWTVSDPESAVIIDSGCVDTTITSDTAGTTLTCEAHSAGGSSSDSVTIMRDATAPTISGSATPSPNTDGWNNADVTVSFTCGDALSGIFSCTADSTLVEGADQSVTGTAKDNAGNTDSDTVSNIDIDMTLPGITGSKSPGPNANGWNNVDVTVSFLCTDGLSGIKSCTDPITLSAEGQDQEATGTAVDYADNSASVTVTGINIDKTQPTISGTPTTLANANNWYKNDVIIAWTTSDELSGIDPATDPADSTISTEGTDLFATESVSDLAGNSNTADSSPKVNIDKTLPDVSLVDGPADGESYYFGSVPAVPTCSASDALSGLDGSCSISGYSTAVGSHTVTATATDKAGNTNSDTASYTVLAWTLKGFYQPVDMDTLTKVMVNIVKGGSTVPLKFEIFAGPTELTATTYGTPSAPVGIFSAKKVACDSSDTPDEIEVYTTGGTVFRYDGTSGQYIYNWQVPKGAGICYDTTFTAADGSMLTAHFKSK
jgi:hypothetical protein